MATQCRIEAVKLHVISGVAQPVITFENAEYLNEIVKYNPEDETVNIFFAYVWDDEAEGEQGQDPFATERGQTVISARLLDTGTAQPLDTMSNLVGVVWTKDGFKTVMLNTNPFGSPDNPAPEVPEEETPTEGESNE